MHIWVIISFRVCKIGLESWQKWAFFSRDNSALLVMTAKQALFSGSNSAILVVTENADIQLNQ